MIDWLLESEVQPRDDYNELLLLCLIFIDNVPRQQVKFYKSGAFSRARWMAKAIYCLKIFLFHEVFRLTPSEHKSLAEICIFIVIIYIGAWFSAPLSAAASNNDLDFLKRMYEYNRVNPIVSRVALKKMSNHLWYLNAENAAMEFFDDAVSVEIKKKMVEKMKSRGIKPDKEKDVSKRYQVFQSNVTFLLDKDIDFFISPESIAFFERFQIDCTFLDTDVSV